MSDTNIIMSLGFFLVFGLAVTTSAQAMYPQYSIVSSTDLFQMGGAFTAVAIGCSGAILTAGLSCGAGVAIALGILYAPTIVSVTTDAVESSSKYAVALYFYNQSDGRINLFNNSEYSKYLTGYNDTLKPSTKASGGSIATLIFSPIILVLGFMIAKMARGQG